MLWKRIIVGDGERALVTKNGRFGGILSPGEYRLFVTAGVSLGVEKHHVREIVFQSAWAEYLAKERPDVAERHFTRVETNHLQVAMVYLDGKLFQVMLPAKRMLFWRGVVEVTAEVVNVIDDPQVPAQKLPAQYGFWAGTESPPFAVRINILNKRGDSPHVSAKTKHGNTRAVPGFVVRHRCLRSTDSVCRQ